MADFAIYRRMNWDGLVHEYDLDGSRLRPWPNYPMPFSGGWCVVRPHTRTLPHTQVDQEIFVGVKGSAKLIVGERSYDFGFGDIAAIPKQVNHYFENNGDDDFHFYVVWWDEPHARQYLSEMSENPGAGHE